jgi:hypothetical protein
MKASRSEAAREDGRADEVGTPTQRPRKLSKRDEHVTERTEQDSY